MQQRTAVIDDYVARILADQGAAAQSVSLLQMLGAMELSAEEQLRVYHTLLSHPHGVIRQSSLNALARLGKRASVETSAVLKLLTSPDEPSYVVAAAAMALSQIADPTPDSLRALTDRLQSDSVSSVVLGVLAALERFGPSGAHALDAIHPYLSSHDTAIQLAALRAQGEILGVRASVPRGDPEQWAADLAVQPDFGYAALKVLVSNVQIDRSLVRFALAAVRVASLASHKCLAMQVFAITGIRDHDELDPVLKSLDTQDTVLASFAAAALAHAEVRDSTSLAALIERLDVEPFAVRLEVIRALTRAGTESALAIPNALAHLARVNGRTDAIEIGAWIDLVRASGRGDQGVAERMVTFLDDGAPLYRDRSKHVARAIRSYVLLSIVEIGIVATATPYVLEDLASADTVQGFAAAARALPKLPSTPHSATKLLLRALAPDFHDQPVNLERFLADGFTSTPAEQTWGRLEAIRAMAELGARASSAAPDLRAIASGEREICGPEALRIRDAARQALETILK